MADAEVLAGALAALARGDREALAVIYDAIGCDMYGLALWRTGNRDDAEDSVQEVFVRLVSTSASLETVKNPRAYLLGMVHRAAVDILRARRRTAPLDETFLLDGGAGPGDNLAAQEASLAVARLTPEQREVVYLRHFCDLSFAQIGKSLGISLFTAASRHRLAVDHLRTWMGVPA